MVSSQELGRLPTGENVRAWTLTSRSGALLRVMEYGGIVTHLRVPGRHGPDDVVLGFDHLEPYLAGHPYFGAIAGRIAGRVTGGKFALDGRTYPLAVNDPPNHLHGGRVGLDKRGWRGEAVARPDGAASVRLTLRSEDGEEGYPGALDLAVTFTLTDRNEFIFDTEIASDRPTPASLTHHSYFNLSGEGSGSILDHRLQIHADAFAPTDAAMTLLGRREPVAGRAEDFRRPARIGDQMGDILGSHGDLYFVNRSGTSGAHLRPAARVTDPASGRVLDVSTTEDCLQFYSGVSLDGSLSGKSGRPYGKHHGFCLECEGYPDGVNTPVLGDIIVRPGAPRRGTTVYAFSFE